MMAENYPSNAASFPSPRCSTHIKVGSCQIIEKAVAYFCHHLLSEIVCVTLVWKKCIRARTRSRRDRRWRKRTHCLYMFAHCLENPSSSWTTLRTCWFWLIIKRSDEELLPFSWFVIITKSVQPLAAEFTVSRGGGGKTSRARHHRFAPTCLCSLFCCQVHQCLSLFWCSVAVFVSEKHWYHAASVAY